MEKDILKKWQFSQPPSEIWDYLTKSELIEQWLTKNDFKPVVGHKFTFIAGTKADPSKPNNSYCEVLQVVPLKLLSYTWRKGRSESDFDVDSVVTWTLSEKNGGTELQLQHNGFKLLEDAIAHSNGWDVCLNRMIQHINSTENAHTNP